MIINSYVYFDQVRGYMNYLKTISDKKISGYLYSILEGIYIELDKIDLTNISW